MKNMKHEGDTFLPYHTILQSRSKFNIKFNKNVKKTLRDRVTLKYNSNICKAAYAVLQLGVSHTAFE